MWLHNVQGCLAPLLFNHQCSLRRSQEIHLSCVVWPAQTVHLWFLCLEIWLRRHIPNALVHLAFVSIWIHWFASWIRGNRSTTLRILFCRSQRRFSSQRSIDSRSKLAAVFEFLYHLQNIQNRYYSSNLRPFTLDWSLNLLVFHTSTNATNL